MRHLATTKETKGYREVVPPLVLAEHIESCWFFEPGFSEPTRDILVPEGVVDVIFNFGAPYYREPANDSSAGDWMAGDFIVGQRSDLFTIEWPVDTRLFAIRLKPETAYVFFDFPLRQITNGAQPAIGTRFEALSILVHSHRFEERRPIAVQCFDHLAQMVTSVAAPDTRIADVIREIRMQEGRVEVQGLSDKLGINRRTIERLFAAKVGISAKFFARIIRLHHFLTLQREHGRGNLAGTAVDAQYYDQSHLIKDFKRFTGESPARFFGSPPEIYEPLLASLFARRSL